MLSEGRYILKIYKLPGVHRRPQRGTWPVTSRLPRDQHDWQNRRSLDTTGRRRSEQLCLRSHLSAIRTYTDRHDTTC